MSDHGNGAAHASHRPEVEHIATVAEHHVGHGMGNLIRRADIFLDLFLVGHALSDVFGKLRAHKKETHEEHAKLAQDYYALKARLDYHQQANLERKLEELGGFRAQGLRHTITHIAKENDGAAFAVLQSLANSVTLDEFRQHAEDGLIHHEETAYVEHQAANYTGATISGLWFGVKVLFHLVEPAIRQQQQRPQQPGPGASRGQRAMHRIRTATKNFHLIR